MKNINKDSNPIREVTSARISYICVNYLSKSKANKLNLNTFQFQNIFLLKRQSMARVNRKQIVN